MEDLDRIGGEGFRGLEDHADDLTWSEDASFVLQQVGPSVRHLLGYLPGELVGSDARGLVHDEDRDELDAARAQATELPGVPVRSEMRLRHRDGRWRWFSAILVNALASPGVHAILSRLYDVTDLKVALAKQQESERQLRQIIDLAPAYIYARDTEQRMVLTNAAFAAFFGRLPEECEGRPLRELAPHLEYSGDIARMDAAVLAHGPSVTEDTLVLPSGATQYLQTHLVPFHTVDDKPAVLGISIDISARKRLEQVRVRSAELELTNQRIGEASRLKSEFLANMSHELRTPLNAILGFAQLMYDGVVPMGSPEAREFMGDILTSGKHLLGLINDVLDLSKVEAGKIELRPEPVDIAELISEVVSIQRTTAAQKHVRVEVEVGALPAETALDPSRFKQVLYNFTSNALKFTSEGGRVIVRATAHGEDAVRLEVEDTGIGIAPEDIGKLFIEFQQLDQGFGKKHGGTGLGLALTKRLVEAQGGSVGVRSELGKGSVFHAIIPCRGKLEPLDEARARAGGKLVLVVEDDPSERKAIVDALEANGFDVDVARDAGEAKARCREHVYDAITLDLVLPDGNGLDLLTAIRASGENRNTPAIVVTVVAAKTFGVDVDAVIEKPFVPEKLVEAIRSATRGVEPARA